MSPSEQVRGECKAGGGRRVSLVGGSLVESKTKVGDSWTGYAAVNGYDCIRSQLWRWPPDKLFERPSPSGKFWPIRFWLQCW